MSWTITPQTKVPVDPQYGSVSLLLHGNQSGGQFIDSSPTPKSITKAGNVAPGSPGGGTPIYPSSNSAFGSAIAFDGTGDYLSVPVNSDLSFGTSDFTIECWIYIVANSSPNQDTNRPAQLLGTSLSSFGGTFIEFQIAGTSATTGTGISFTNAVSGSSSTSVVYTGTIAKTTWHHVALVRSGTTTSIYLNGTSVASGTLSNQTINQVHPIWVGGQNLPNYNHYFNGYIDDLRITKGVARYTSNFTPPAAPFPDI
jgi:hypothetical protein